MEHPLEADETAKNVLIHLYNSTVVGSINSTAMLLRMKKINEVMNPRYRDLKELYERLGAEHRQLFFKVIASIAEFAIFSTLDFVENYNRFESEANDDELPRLSLVYHFKEGNETKEKTVSKFGSNDLGMLFKEIARLDEVRKLVDSVVTNNAQART